MKINELDILAYDIYINYSRKNNLKICSTIEGFIKFKSKYPNGYRCFYNEALIELRKNKMKKITKYDK